jgi:DNA-binding NtrC family response regulator
MLTRLLLVVHDAQLTERLRRLLLEGGIEPEIAAGPTNLGEKLAHGDFDLVVADRHSLPRTSGEFVASLHRLPEHTGVIVLTDEDKPEERAELLSSGCLAVLWLGLNDGKLRDALVALTQRQSDEVRGRLGAERIEKRSSLNEFVANSPSMQQFLSVARRVVRSESPLLILGETGVGKERLARSIHSESARSSGPFIAVHCGALPETLLESELFGHEEGAFTGAIRARRGYFELAHRGTICLDEMGEMPLHLQVKLLRVLEDRRIQRLGGERPVEVDVRVIAATNRNLKQDMEDGRFRPDLYYRLAVVTLTVPPLRERREDLPELAQTFLERFKRQMQRPVTRIRPEAMAAMVRYDWPGNVRELINVLERAVLLSSGNEIDVADLRGRDGWVSTPSGTDEPIATTPEGNRDDLMNRPFKLAREEVISSFEQNYIQDVLRKTGGRIGESARRAGLNERSLYALMKRHRLRKEDFK